MRSLVSAAALVAAFAFVGCSNSDKSNGGAGGTAASGGDAGSGGTSTGPAEGGLGCVPTAAVNEADLTVRRPDIGTRIIGSLAGSLVIRIAQDPLTGGIFYMNQDGQFWQLDAESGESTAVDMGQTGHDFRGMAFGPDGTLYVLGNEGVLGTESSVLIQKGVLGDAGVRSWTTIASSDLYPAGGSDFDHRFAGLAVSPDGQSLYFGSGSRTDHGEVEGRQREVALTSAIFRLATDETDLILLDDDASLQPYLFADGVRNPFDMDFNGEGELFAIDNGPDLDFPEEINWVREGKHYGFPWRFGAEANPVMDAAFESAGDKRLHVGYQAFDRGSYVYDAEFPEPRAGVQFVDPILNHGPDGDLFRSGPDSDVLDASEMGQTLAGLTAHRSPLGLTFDTADSLCGDFRGAGFVLSFGPVLNVMGDAGGDLMMLQMTKVGGAYEMHTTQLVAGFQGPVDSVLVGNKLYVVEFTGGAGNIYEITFPTAAP